MLLLQVRLRPLHQARAGCILCMAAGAGSEAEEWGAARWDFPQLSGSPRSNAKSAMHKGKKHKRSKGTKGCSHKNEAPSSVAKAPAEPGFEDLPHVLQVKHSQVMGRYLVTTRDVKPGETLLPGEEALVSGPCQGGCPARCLGCSEPLTLPLCLGYHCARCGLPMCKSTCPSAEQHAPECELLCSGGQVPLAPQLLDERPELYNAIVPLRCLYLRDNQPDKWRLLMTMEAHNDVRKARSIIWNTNYDSVVKPIREMWGLGSKFTDLEIHTVCGVLEVNAFEVGSHGRNARALFPRAFLMAHDCVPNTCHTDDCAGRLRVRASTHIPAGQPVTLSYAYTLQGTLKRREHLREGKFFDCACRRCADPTELGTYCSALLCPRCHAARVLSTDPLRDDAEWRCTACNEYAVAASSVQRLLERLGEEAEDLDPNNLEHLENFIIKYERILPASHYLILGVKHTLSQVYGKLPGFLINQLTNDQLERKRDICREILPVFDVLEPGMSRLRGVTLYELHAPLMVLASRASESRNFLKADLQASLREVAQCLEQARSILSFEPEGSAEHGMAEAAENALKQVTEWRQHVANTK